MGEKPSEKIDRKLVTHRLDFKEIIKLNVVVLQMSGNFIPEFKSKIAMAIYFVYAVFFVVTIFVSMVTSEVINIIMVLNDLEKLTDASFLALTHVVQIIKFYNLYKNQRRVKHLLNSINRKEFQPKNRNQYVTLTTYVRNSKIITTLFLLAGIITCSFWGLYPITAGGELFLPLAGWYPFDTSESPAFEMIFVYQVASATLNALSNISLDSFMSGFIYFLMLTTEVINMVLVFGDMEKTTEASFLTLTHLVQLGKIHALTVYRDKLEKILTDIDRTEFQPKNNTQFKILNSYIRRSKLQSKIFIIVCVLTCLFWGFCPFVGEEDFQLPLAEWFPFDTASSPGFQVAYVYQVLSSTINALANVSIDTLIYGLIMVVCAQLNILNDSLLHLREYAETELEDAGIQTGHLMTKELQDKMNEKLVECVVHHRCILEYAKEVQFLFSNSILGQFIVSVIIICITLFEITLLPFMSLKFFSLILYQSCMLTEIYLLCHYGNEVVWQSSELTMFAYRSDWTDCSQEFKRNLVFFMSRSQVALKLYAGGFFTLSLETFVKIVKSSYSYYAVLNSRHNKN